MVHHSGQNAGTCGGGVGAERRATHVGRALAAAERRRCRTNVEWRERTQGTNGGDGTALQSAAAGAGSFKGRLFLSPVIFTSFPYAWFPSPSFPRRRASRRRVPYCAGLLIGVGNGFRRPRPPNRACGSPAHGSPVGGFLIGIGVPEHGLRSS